MKMINSIGPNPKVVRMFAAERGIDLELDEVDLLAGANRTPEYLKKNPSGQVPALEMDDGTYLAEILPICEYLEEKQGPSDLIGTTPEARAETRMWARRIDLQILEPATSAFRYAEGKSIFEGRVRLIPQAADDLKILAAERLAWLNDQIEGKQFICGDRFSMADVLLFCFLEFLGNVGQPLNESNTNLVAWYERVKARPSSAA